jgi:predicted nucleic acid-binding protein
MIFLPDVNIWIALTSNRHVHHSLATEWLQGIENEQIAFCRISELSFLRLLTNAHVMGKDVLSPLKRGLSTMSGERMTA